MQLTLGDWPGQLTQPQRGIRAARKWWTQARRRAKAYAEAIQAACMPLWKELRVGGATVIGFMYEDDLRRADANRRKPRLVHRECWNCNANTQQRLTYLGNCRCLTCGCRSTCGAEEDADDIEP